MPQEHGDDLPTIAIAMHIYSLELEYSYYAMYGGPEVQSVVFVARFTSSIRSLIR